jgi:hypothetical protein
LDGGHCPWDEFKDKLSAELAAAHKEGYTVTLHVSHDMMMVGATATIVSALIVLGKPAV